MIEDNQDNFTFFDLLTSRIPFFGFPISYNN